MNNLAYSDLIGSYAYFRKFHLTKEWILKSLMIFAFNLNETVDMMAILRNARKYGLNQKKKNAKQNIFFPVSYSKRIQFSTLVIKYFGSLN